MRTLLAVFLSLMMAPMVACLGAGDAQRTLACGAGDAVDHNGAAFCVFAAPLIIEGFLCPEAVPYAFTSTEGHVVCSEQGTLPPGGVEPIIDTWQQGTVGPQGDVVAPDLTAPDTVGADATASDASDTVAGPPTACEAALDVAVGADVSVAALGRTCAAVSACGDPAVFADCGAEGVYYCRCRYGDVACAAWGSRALECPAPGAAADALCERPLAEDACVPGHYCFQDIEVYPGQCTALPALCNDRACWSATDCASGARCDGADIATAAIGTCRARPAQGRCVTAADCAPGFVCDGAAVGCDAACTCADPLAQDAAGTCVQSVVADAPVVWLDAGQLRAGQPVTPRWTRGAGAAGLYALSCPTFDVELRDETTLQWSVVSSEVCAAAFIPLAAGANSERPPITLTLPAGADYAQVRLRGRYYTGCSPTGSLDSCAGPVETTSAVSVLVP